MNTVKQILKTKGNNVYTITPSTPVMDALKIMDNKGIGVLIVTQDDKLKGFFTEGDYLSRVLLKDKDIDTTTVADVMTKKVLTINPSQTVNESMQLMIDKDIRYLPVLDDENLVGLISMGDCVKRVIAEQEELIGHLEHYIQS